MPNEERLFILFRIEHKIIQSIHTLPADLQSFITVTTTTLPIASSAERKVPSRGSTHSCSASGALDLLERIGKVSIGDGHLDALDRLAGHHPLQKLPANPRELRVREDRVDRPEPQQLLVGDGPGGPEHRISLASEGREATALSAPRRSGLARDAGWRIILIFVRFL